MHVSRLFGFAAVLLNGVCAGTIDSKNGNATVTPAPRRNVRRERCFFVINMVTLLELSNNHRDTKALRRVRTSVPLCLCGYYPCLLHLHLKRRALHDPYYERRKTIIIARGVANYRPDHRHVVIMYCAAD